MLSAREALVAWQPLDKQSGAGVRPGPAQLIGDCPRAGPAPTPTNSYVPCMQGRFYGRRAERYIGGDCRVADGKCPSPEREERTLASYRSA